MEMTTVKTAEELGLLADEFEQIKEILGRTPNFAELSIFSVMWSEHCSYKNSIHWLKKLPKEGPMMLAEAGEENAGLVDIGDGLACCFKIESHNHPSALEPYQGAATGVGGINRDIFSMGARPIAQLNSLRFGNINSDRTKWLVKGVVKGIGDYGNSFGIPTVGGEVYFDDCYETNILVNAMSVGIMGEHDMVSAIAEGVGNPVYIFGSRTGKDGIHGAAFASKDISENSTDDLPSVQVGDPFWEKLILEGSMEIIKTGHVIGMQDMGAAGITCSSAEMSAKSGTGMLIDLDKVPLRQDDMKDWEILLSESQERMLVIIDKGNEADIEAIFEKWDLEYSIIGEVTDTGRVQFMKNGEMAADIPSDSLVLGGGAPVYQREWTEPDYFKELQNFDSSAIAEPENLVEVAKSLCAEPNIASKKWVFNQYDSMVGTINQSTNTATDAAVVKVRDTNKSLALTVDCNSRYIHADPEKGTAIAVSEAARNIVCTGGEPSGITNCLNFGNPYNKEVFWQFKSAILGMKQAAEKFKTPVTGGNVSFYNQSTVDGKAVFPTPTIGMVGVIEDSQRITSMDFKNEGDVIVLIGKASDDMNSSQYLAKYHKVDLSPCPYFDIEEEYAMHQAIKDLITAGTLNSCHDVSEGGIFVSLLESSMTSGIGFEISSDPELRTDAYLFGEAQGRAIVTISKNDLSDLERIANNHNVPFTVMGTTSGKALKIDSNDFGSIEEYRSIYDNAIETALMN
jgi:phosphoribosylformylglycinamidine synthase subunit PurL